MCNKFLSVKGFSVSNMHSPVITHISPSEDGVSNTKLDKLVLNGQGESAEFPKVDFNCLNGQYPVTLKGMDIFEWAIENLKIGVILLFKIQNLRKVSAVIKASAESVKHWVWFSYTPATEFR